MKLGLIGHPLEHSWSPLIHRKMIAAEYQLWPLKADEVRPFLQKRDFDGINVTIPYKKTVLQEVDKLSEEAEKIEAANCIINRNGRLIAYNTDYFGFLKMAASHADFKNRKTAILGSGGASAAVKAAIETLEGIAVIVSRDPKKDMISYEELYRKQEEFSFIVNTTPLGMYPHNDEVPVDLSLFSKLQAVFDIIANPLRSRLLFDAKMLKIPAYSGIEMLVEQAYEADKLFLAADLDPTLAERCLKEVLLEKRNIALIGMPTSGKTTISGLLAEKLNKNVIEIDDEIRKIIRMPIRDYFSRYGEENFRKLESEQIRRLQNRTGIIISCGGGVIKKIENMQHLFANSLIIGLDRDLDKLKAEADRPLSANREDLERLYQERHELYKRYSDLLIDNNGTPAETVEKILACLKG